MPLNKTNAHFSFLNPRLDFSTYRLSSWRVFEKPRRRQPSADFYEGAPCAALATQNGHDVLQVLRPPVGIGWCTLNVARAAQKQAAPKGPKQFLWVESLC